MCVYTFIYMYTYMYIYVCIIIHAQMSALYVHIFMDLFIRGDGGPSMLTCTGIFAVLLEVCAPGKLILDYFVDISFHQHRGWVRFKTSQNIYAQFARCTTLSGRLACRCAPPPSLPLERAESVYPCWR